MLSNDALSFTVVSQRVLFQGETKLAFPVPLLYIDMSLINIKKIVKTMVVKP